MDETDARARIELLALRLGLHGPSAATLRVCRPLGRSKHWLEVRILLREHGFSEAEIAHLMNVHPRGCACWECVRKLRDAVKRHRRKLEGGDAHAQGRRETGRPRGRGP